MWVRGAIRAATFTLALPLMLTNLSAVAGPDDSTWPVEGRLIGEKGKKSKDISGIACTKPQGFPRSCLVIDDNRQQTQFVTLKDGEIVAATPSGSLRTRSAGSRSNWMARASLSPTAPTM